MFCVPGDPPRLAVLETDYIKLHCQVQWKLCEMQHYNQEVMTTVKQVGELVKELGNGNRMALHALTEEAERISCDMET